MTDNISVLTRFSEGGTDPQSRQLQVGSGLQLQDAGGAGTYTTMIAPASLLAQLQGLSSNGIIVKSDANTLVVRDLQVDNTLILTNDDGVAGNMTLGVNDGSTVQRVQMTLNGGDTIYEGYKINVIPVNGAGADLTQVGDTIDFTITADGGGGGGGGAPINAHYVVTQDNGVLTNEFNLGSLTSGLMALGVSGSVGTPFTVDVNLTSVPADGVLVMGTVPEDLVDGTANNAGFGWGSLANITTGQNNAGSGQNTLNLLTTGSGNTATGSLAGDSQVLYTNSTFVGFGADASANGLTNANAIGAGAVVSTSNTMRLGANGTSVVIGDTTYSSGAYALNLQAAGSSASIYMSRTPSQAALSASGGVYSVTNADNPYFTSYVPAQSGQIITAVAGTAPIAQAQSLLLGNGNNYTTFPMGTANQVLQVNSTGTALEFAAPPAFNVFTGQATLVNGTITVSTADVDSNSNIQLTYNGTLTNPGILSVGTRTTGVSFVINSTNALDASTVNWQFT
jgi:hypothetical protein